MLEAIYEPVFLNTSHDFRPNWSCQTALFQIKSTCRGTKWVVEGDITGYFDNVDHDILLQILSRKIHDGRFLELIRRFLKAGYFEFHQVKNSLSGVPQGDISSPILSNIYMHEFDAYYNLATDVAVKINKFKCYHYWSLLKTIAHREKPTTTMVKEKYGVGIPRKVGKGTRKLIGMRYPTKKANAL